MLSRLMLFLFAFVLFSFSSLSEAAQYGVYPATTKVLPDSPVPPERSVQLKAMRNEWEGFQVVLRNETALENVNASIGALENESGETIPAEGFRLYKEHFLNVTNASTGGKTHHPREEGLYPDPLIPFVDYYAEERPPVGAPFRLEANDTAIIYADLYVPMETSSGDYNGMMTITADGMAAIEIPILVSVWELAIPMERSIATAYGFDGSRIDYFHRDKSEEGGRSLQEIIDLYFLSMHEHRMDPTRIHAPINWEFDENGELLPVDWTSYDEAIAPWVEGTRFPDGVGVKKFSVEHFKPGRGTGGMTDEQYATAAKVFAEHMVEKGWWDNAYVYASDEPWLHGSTPRILRDAEKIFSKTDLWQGHILVTGPYDEMIADYIGIWCPVTPMYEEWYYIDSGMAGWDTYTECFERGQKLWFYVCNANYPPYAGYDIDSTLGHEPRIVKWGAWYERGSGFLYWRMNRWYDDDPWNVFLDAEHFGEWGARAGDGFLFYPGNHEGTKAPKGSPEWLAYDGPIISYRMKQIRDGLEDWELFIQTSEAGGEAFVRAQVERAYTQFGTFSFESCIDNPSYYCPDDPPWTLDASVMMDAREMIAKKALYLLHPDSYEDPEASEPVVDGDIDEMEAETVEEAEANESEETAVMEDGDIEADQFDAATERNVYPPDKKDDGGCRTSQAPDALLLLGLAIFMVLWFARRRAV